MGYNLKISKKGRNEDSKQDCVLRNLFLEEFMERFRVHIPPMLTPVVCLVCLTANDKNYFLTMENSEAS